jgi:hypothetical protein
VAAVRGIGEADRDARPVGRDDGGVWDVLGSGDVRSDGRDRGCVGGDRCGLARDRPRPRGSSRHKSLNADRMAGVFALADAHASISHANAYHEPLHCVGGFPVRTSRSLCPDFPRCLDECC